MLLQFTEKCRFYIFPPKKFNNINYRVLNLRDYKKPLNSAKLAKMSPCRFYRLQNDFSIVMKVRSWTYHLFSTLFPALDETQCDQIWRNFTTLAKRLQVLGKIFMVDFLFRKMLILLWQIFDIIGLNFHGCK